MSNQTDQTTIAPDHSGAEPIWAAVHERTRRLARPLGPAADIRVVISASAACATACDTQLHNFAEPHSDVIR